MDDSSTPHGGAPHPGSTPHASLTGYRGVKKRTRKGRTVYIARRVIDGRRREKEFRTPEEASEWYESLRPDPPSAGTPEKPRRTVQVRGA